MSQLTQEQFFLILSRVNEKTNELLQIEKTYPSTCFENYVYIGSMLSVMKAFRTKFDFEFEHMLFNDILDEVCCEDDFSFMIAFDNEIPQIITVLIDYLIDILLSKSIDTPEHLQKILVFLDLRISYGGHRSKPISVQLTKLIIAMRNVGRDIDEINFAPLASYARSYFEIHPQDIPYEIHSLLYPTPHRTLDLVSYPQSIPLQNASSQHPLRTHQLIPFIIYLAMELYSETIKSRIKHDFFEFQRTFRQVNNHSKADFKRFISTEHLKISQLIYIMNDYTFEFLKLSILGSLTKLEKLFLCLPVFSEKYLIPLRYIFTKYKSQITANPGNRILWERILFFTSIYTSHMQMSNVGWDIGDLGVVYFQLASNTDDIHVFFAALKQQFLDIIVDKMDVNSVGFKNYACQIALAFPQFANVLMEKITATQEQFQYFQGDLSCAISSVIIAFPQFNEEFFVITDQFKALKRKLLYLQGKAEIVEKSKIIAQGNRTLHFCLFKTIPKVTQAEIASYTGAHGAHDFEAFEKPTDIAWRVMSHSK